MTSLKVFSSNFLTSFFLSILSESDVPASICVANILNLLQESSRETLYSLPPLNYPSVR